MTFKRISIILFLVFSLLPLVKIYGANSNAGFIPANIWYSKDPFEEGDKIKIYTLVFNPDARELSGNVVFFDNSILLGKKDFTAPPKSTKEISIDWKVNTGDHTIFGKIENAKFLVSAGKYEEVYLAENETEKSKSTVAKKIILKTDTNNMTNLAMNSLVDNASKFVEDKVPNVVKKPINEGLNVVEDFRQNTGKSIETKKETVKSEIKSLENKSIPTKDSNVDTSGKLLKPFKYMELFLLNILSFILNTKILFYLISISILFYLIKFIWGKIF